MEDKKLIPRRRVLGLGVALAGLCSGCAVLPDGSTESAAGSQAASGEKAADKVEKAPLAACWPMLNSRSEVVSLKSSMPPDGVEYPAPSWLSI